ncbi:phosphatidate phosphatase LPIN3 [Biomphalaria pfeifferi]|uniref:Phosphatidate phosphatase LPIN3 n=1 Tax=Biomphalaria pfeifferi TaxID=112525 RepID=A0AAD8EY91_BIOPF|nr:phosphatidate phosphatase LPIN3 [Biomphalaria pfeifferi]
MMSDKEPHRKRRSVKKLFSNPMRRSSSADNRPRLISDQSRQLPDSRIDKKTGHAIAVLSSQEIKSSTSSAEKPVFFLEDVPETIGLDSKQDFCDVGVICRHSHPSDHNCSHSHPPNRIIQNLNSACCASPRDTKDKCFSLYSISDKPHNKVADSKDLQMYSSLGGAHASLRCAALQDILASCPHQCECETMQNPLREEILSSPLWEWVADDDYFDCFEPGEYPVRTSNTSMSRSSSTTSFKSLSDSQLVMSPSSYMTPPSTAVFSDMFNFSVPSSSSCTTSTPGSASTSFTTGSKSLSVPVMTLFNHSLNFWTMEID